MELSKRIEAFVKLGHQLNKILNDKSENSEFNALLETVYSFNGWFTENNVRLAITELVNHLNEEELNKWLSKYEFENSKGKTVGIVMAGNIPLVGFHDLMCVLLSGNNALIKMSSSDDKLLPFIYSLLIKIEPGFSERVVFSHEKLKGIDAIIATGSNNTSRYFEYYFSKYPNIIRKNRNSIAVIDSEVTKNEIYELGKDIFTFYGLGCRSVSKLFVPKGYDFKEFFEAIFEYGYVIDNKKYVNNYEYNRTIYLMNKEKVLDNNFLLLKEDIGLSSPIGVLYYEYYSSEDFLNERLRQDAAHIQVVVGRGQVPFGKAQQPLLSDYADGVDTISFLTGLD